MKIDAFKLVFKFNDVEVFEFTETDLPFTEIFNKYIVGRVILGDDNFFYKKFKKPEHSYNRFIGFRNRHFQSKYTKIPLKINKKTRIINGIILYSSKENFIRFLMKHIDYSVNCDLNDYLKECSGINGKINFDIIFIKKIYDDFFRDEEVFIYKSKNDFFNNFKKITNNSDTFLLEKSSPEHIQRIFALEKLIKISGYNVPAVDFIYHGFDERENSKQIVVSSIDNEIKFYDSIYDINPAFLNKMDKEGKVYNGTKFDLLPDNSKEVFAILRVPAKKEYIKYRKTNKKTKSEMDILNKVFFVSPSLKAARLKPDIKVIDDIDIFEKIYSRLSSGIYIPGNLSVEMDADILPDNEQFLFLEKPI